MDVKAIVKKVQQKKVTDRKRTSIYVSQRVWRDFKKLAGDRGASLLLEELMSATIEEAEKRK
jgi:hypothetical protein